MRLRPKAYRRERGDKAAQAFGALHPINFCQGVAAKSVSVPCELLSMGASANHGETACVRASPGGWPQQTHSSGDEVRSSNLVTSPGADPASTDSCTPRLLLSTCYGPRVIQSASLARSTPHNHPRPPTHTRKPVATGQPEATWNMAGLQYRRLHMYIPSPLAPKPNVDSKRSS